MTFGRAVADAVEALPPLSPSASRILELYRSPSWHPNDFVEVIRFDPTLVVRVLRRANSSMDRGRSPVTQLQDAVVRLGVSTVLTLALSGAVKRMMLRPVEAYGLAEGELWRHVIASSVAAEAIAKASKCKISPDVSPAALLHDLGKLVIASLDVPALRGELARRGASEDTAALEREVIGVDHAQLAGLAVERWNLPHAIVLAVTNHHSPNNVNDPVCDAVHLADAVAYAAERGAEQVSAYDSGARERLGLGAEDLDGLIASVVERSREIMTQG